MLAYAAEQLDAELVKQGWKIVAKNQAKIHDLVKDMLSFSKEREPQIENVDINALVNDVIALMKSQAQARGHPPADSPWRVARLSGRSGRHSPIALDIVTNAFDAVEDRDKAQVGIVTLLEASSDGTGDWVKVQVVDNGVGIAPEDLADIFKPFESSKGERGTGLGLAVSRKTLREHGGDILVQSVPGKGSRFELRFPVLSPLASDNTLNG